LPLKLLVDINVVLDVILEREEFLQDSGELLTAIDEDVAGLSASGFIAGHTVTTIHYITTKQKSRREADAAVSDLLRIVRVVPVELIDFAQALALDLRDFEDAVQAAAALKVGADYLVTRNPRDFAGVPGLEVRTPAQVLALL
jgi:predicted nucleic acid-binding protein